MLKKIIKQLSSLRFTIVLICLLGVMFIIGLWVPQKDLLRDIYYQWKQSSPRLVFWLDFFQLTSVYTSWLTLSFWFSFFTNLTLVLWQRIPVVRKRIEISPARIAPPETAPGYPFRESYLLPDGMDGAALMKAISAKGYRLIGSEAGFYGVKNRLSPIAFGLFHISFYLIMLGGLISFYSQFIGYVDLAQGEHFQGELYQYNSKPYPQLPKIGKIPQASFTIKSIVPHVVRNTPTGIDVTLVDQKGESHVVDINQPYTDGPSSFVFRHLGVAPLFVLKDTTGKELGGSFFKIDVVGGKEDIVRIGDVTFKVHYYPDYELKNGRHGTKSMEFNNPVFTLIGEQGGKKIGEGTLKKNGTLAMGDYRLELRDVPYWVRFYVVKQHGLPIVYIGFAIASIAVIWRLIFFRRELVGALREENGVRRLVVAGRSEYYKNLAIDEFRKLFGELFKNRS